MATSKVEAENRPSVVRGNFAGANNGPMALSIYAETWFAILAFVGES
jgi:hypothetical protein